jgi:hypothetical protein
VPKPARKTTDEAPDFRHSRCGLVDSDVAERVLADHPKRLKKPIVRERASASAHLGHRYIPEIPFLHEAIHTLNRALKRRRGHAIRGLLHDKVQNRRAIIRRLVAKYVAEGALSPLAQGLMFCLQVGIGASKFERNPALHPGIETGRSGIRLVLPGKHVSVSGDDHSTFLGGLDRQTGRLVQMVSRAD